jgi:hypothetical protein
MREVVRKGGRRVNTEQKMCTHACKSKKWYLLRVWHESGEGEIRRAVEGVNLSMIYLKCCKKLWIGGVAQVLEHLLCKCEVLRSTLISPSQKKKPKNFVNVTMYHHPAQQ